MLLTHFQLIEKQEKYELILKSGDCVVNSNFKSQKKLPTLDINKFLNLAFVHLRLYRAIGLLGSKGNWLIEIQY